MKFHRLFWTSIVAGMLAIVGGCGLLALWDVGNPYLALEIEAFDGPDTLAVTDNSVTHRSVEVRLPEDLLDDAPSEAFWLLSESDLSVTLLQDPVGSPAARQHRATVSFRIAPQNQDACASEQVIGPFEITVQDGRATLDVNALPIDGRTRAAIRTGRINLCAEASADFTGTVAMGKMTVEFGRVPQGQQKVELCHVPPGNPDNRRTITVAEAAVPAHLARGSYLGACQAEPIEPLTVTAECGPADGSQALWIVTNPNDVPRALEWELLELGRSGTITAEPGTTEIATDDITTLVTLVIGWWDENNVRRTAQAVHDPATCDPPDGTAPLAVNAGADRTLVEWTAVPLTADVTGGAPPYHYEWSAPDWEGATEPSVTIAFTGTTTYTLTVSDSASPPQTADDTVTLTFDPRTNLRYTIAPIASLGPGSSYPAGINEAGQVVGYYYDDAQRKRAFLYDNGQMIDLGTLGGTEAYARAINNLGQVVGEARTATGRWHAFLWDSAQGMIDLGTLGGTSSIAYAINDTGQIVGYAATASGTYHAFLYEKGTMTNVTASDYAQAGAFGLNNFGVIVGLGETDAGHENVFIYEDGILTDLGSPLLEGSVAQAVNDAGTIAGNAWGAGSHRAWIDLAGTIIDLDALPGFPETQVWGMSQESKLVGHARSGTLSHAIVYTGGQLRDLNDMLAPGHGWEYLTAAYAVNSAGQIAGYGRIDGRFKGFILTPVE